MEVSCLGVPRGSGGGSGHACRTETPCRERPGKQQGQHQQNGVAIAAVKRVRLRQEFGGSGNERRSCNDQEASQQVEPHDATDSENENAEKYEPCEKLLHEIGGAASASTDHRQRAEKKQQRAKPGSLDFGGNKRGNNHYIGGHPKTTEQSAPKDRGGGKKGIEILAEGSIEKAMHRGPVHRSRCEKPFQAQQPRAASQADRKRVAVVGSRHSSPTREALFSKRHPCVIAANAKQQHQQPKTERASEEGGNAKHPQHCFVRNSGVVGVQKVRDAVAKGKNRIKRNDRPGGPKRKTLPGDRAGRVRPQICEKENQRGEAQAAEQDHGPNRKSFTRKRRFFLLAPPVVGNLNVRAEPLACGLIFIGGAGTLKVGAPIVGDFITEQGHPDALVGVPVRCAEGVGSDRIKRSVPLPGQQMVDTMRARFGVRFEKCPLTQIQPSFLAQILLRARHCFFLLERRASRVFSNFVLQRKKGAVRLEFDGELLGLAIPEITRLPKRSRHLGGVDFVDARDSHSFAKEFVRHRIHDIREDHGAFVRTRIHSAPSEDLVRLGARGLRINGEFQIIANGFRLQAPNDKRPGNQARRENRHHFGGQCVIAARRDGRSAGRRRQGQVQVRRRSSAIPPLLVRFESTANEAGNAGENKRRKGRGGDHHARYLEIKTIRAQKKKTHERSVHRVVPDERRQNAPSQHHDSRNNTNQPDLDASDIGGLLRIVAVQKTPEKCGNNDRHPPRLGEFLEKRNREEAESEFFVGGSQQANGSAGDPRKQRIYRFLIINFLRGPCAQPVGQYIEPDHVGNVHGGQRESHDRRGEEFFRAPSAQRKSVRKPQTLRPRRAIKRLGGRKHQRDGQRGKNGQQKGAAYFSGEEACVGDSRVVTGAPKGPFTQTLQKEKRGHQQPQQNGPAPARLPL